MGTRWVDINKGGSLHMKLRSRLVAQELKRQRFLTSKSSWTDFFACRAVEPEGIVCNGNHREGSGFVWNCLQGQAKAQTRLDYGTRDAPAN